MPDPTAVNSMFSRIARRYDVANHLLSAGLDGWWRRCLVRAVQAARPHEVLDVATGSGDVALALSRKLPPTVRITGMDFCRTMLDEAEKKRHAGGASRFANVAFQQGDGLALPFADESFDVVTISFGLRNMADRHRSLAEMRRVLRSKGRLLVLEFSQPQPWFRPFYFFYLRKIMPLIAGAVTGDRTAYTYLNETIEQFPDRDALIKEIQTAGFRSITAKGLTFGTVALHEAIK